MSHALASYVNYRLRVAVCVSSTRRRRLSCPNFWTSGSVRSGYAAGCAAKAMPRRTRFADVGLCPSFGLRPKDSRAEPVPWAKPMASLHSPAGHSPRRTPGGKADPNRAPETAIDNERLLASDVNCGVRFSQRRQLSFEVAVCVQKIARAITSVRRPRRETRRTDAAFAPSTSSARLAGP